jgi:hypothetical protein
VDKGQSSGLESPPTGIYLWNYTEMGLSFCQEEDCVDGRACLAELRRNDCIEALRDRGRLQACCRYCAGGCLLVGIDACLEWQ